ncbi:MAG TPA: enoyl-CoA hydratase-related protein, partial [Geminicoccaceae bacterium]|nr:enoyl-CoA hydratase-related protein [Geminicoccaceae bacterium]
RMAAVLAERPNKALRICKQAIDLSFDLSEDEAIRQSLPLSEEVFASADCQEGVRAFFEKRSPRFTHS